MWVPVVLMLLAIATILIGMLLIFVSTLSARDRKTEGKSEVGGVIVLGPIPIAFGTSERIVKSLIIISIVFFVIVLAIFITLNSGAPFPKQ